MCMDLSEYLFLLEAETHILQIMSGVVFLGETAQEGFPYISSLVKQF
jgi:hypothetical protein